MAPKPPGAARRAPAEPGRVSRSRGDEGGPDMAPRLQGRLGAARRSRGAWRTGMAPRRDSQSSVSVVFGRPSMRGMRARILAIVSVCTSAAHWETIVPFVC